MTLFCVQIPALNAWNTSRTADGFKLAITHFEKSIRSADEYLNPSIATTTPASVTSSTPVATAATAAPPPTPSSAGAAAAPTPTVTVTTAAGTEPVITPAPAPPPVATEADRERLTVQSARAYALLAYLYNLQSNDRAIECIDSATGRLMELRGAAAERAALLAARCYSCKADLMFTIAENGGTIDVKALRNVISFAANMYGLVGSPQSEDVEQEIQSAGSRLKGFDKDELITITKAMNPNGGSGSGGAGSLSISVPHTPQKIYEKKVAPLTARRKAKVRTVSAHVLVVHNTFFYY